MGLFGKKKYVKNVERDNTFMKDYAVKINGLQRLAEGNDTVTKALKKLQEDFQFTVATQLTDAKKIERSIEKKYKELRETLEKPAWDEQAVLMLIRSIGVDLDDISALRK